MTLTGSAIASVQALPRWRFGLVWYGRRHYAGCAMIRDFLHARRYLAPGPDSFWTWGDGGDVLAWRKGPTIAFRPEVVEVLRPLVWRGYPHFDAVALFLAACRSIEKIGESELVRQKVLPSLSEMEKSNWRYRDLLVALCAIASISREVRGTLAGKKELAAMLFETAYIAEPPESAEIILGALAQRLAQRDVHGTPVPIPERARHAGQAGAAGCRRPPRDARSAGTAAEDRARATARAGTRRRFATRIASRIARTSQNRRRAGGTGTAGPQPARGAAASLARSRNLKTCRWEASPIFRIEVRSTDCS